MPRWLQALKAFRDPFDVEPEYLEAEPVRTLTLTRFAHTGTCTLGRLGKFYTLENPWKDNERSISCIPAGEYKCVPGFYHAGGYECWAIKDVPGRSKILFHVGNWPRNTDGCPLIGSGVGVLKGELAITHSQTAFDEWMASLEDVGEFRLVVEDVDEVSVL